MDTIAIFVFLIAGLLIGGIIGWYYAKSKFNYVSPFSVEEYVSMSNDKLVLEQKVNDLRTAVEDFKRESYTSREKATSFNIEISRLETVNKGLSEKLDSQKAELEDLHKKIREQFENIASKIIFDNSRMIQQQHSDKLTDILNPLKEKIEKFETTVSTTHKESIRENQSLKEQLKLLQEMNKSIGDEARNLTAALKGQVKTQGNWGEVILERVLERSGLTKGQEYDLQVDVTSHEDHRQRPDVIVHLPDEKHIIIDSKVSLNAYEQYISSENPEEQSFQLKKHIVSLRSHIKELGDKNYQQAVNVNTPDFVLLFLPIEASFSVALQYDNEIYAYAWERKVVIVSPTTLLATLRTISSIWRQENQTKNAQEIARLSKALYDKFLAFAEDMDRIKISLDRASGAYSEALKKMKDGKGNMIRTAERIQELGGFDSQKSLPTDFEFF